MEFIQTTKEEVTPKYEKTSLSLSKIRLDATTLLDGLYGRPGQNILSPANIAQEMQPARNTLRALVSGADGPRYLSPY